MTALGFVGGLAAILALVAGPTWAPAAEGAEGDQTVVSAPSSLLVSGRPDRGSAKPLEGAKIHGSVHIFVPALDGVRRVAFYINDPSMRGQPSHVATQAPFDLVGGDKAAARPFMSGTLGRGTAVFTAALDLGGGREQILHAHATVTDAPPAGESGGGLHFSDAELQVWRQRAAGGPYRRSGDAGTNSPGDWDRIASNAAAFGASPTAGRWNGPSVSGCVPKQASHPPRIEASRLRDAAFYGLVTGDTRYNALVKRELLHQAQMSGVDFSNRNRWCIGVINDVAPVLQISHWVAKLLFAYDYLGADAFTAAERKIMDRWFYNAADFMRHDANDSLAGNFVDRWNGNYTLSSSRASNPSYGTVGYFGGKRVGAIARFYNNRRAAIVRTVGLVGIHQDVPLFKKTAKLFAKEFVAYSVYPEGFVGDFERWTSSNPDLGWGYAGNTVGPVITIADHFARAGDTELYNYITSTGVHGTEGGQKSIRFAAQSLGKYVDGTFNRYGTDTASRNGNPEYRITGSNSSWQSVHDMGLVPANTYYKDNYLKGIYTRTGKGTPNYPAKPASNGPENPWQGESGIYPGVLFMYGQTEHLVNPYPTR